MRIAICDDELIYIEQIKNYLLNYEEIYPDMIIETYTCSEDLLKAYDSDRRFDLIFLDIQMEDIDGVAAAQKIREVDNNVIIIFITSHTQFVSETFRVGAFQFLTKPISEIEFRKDFERAIRQYNINNYKYIIKWKEQTTTVDIKDIVYIESYMRHLFIYDGRNKYEFIGKLSTEEEKLKHHNFVRCHQGFLVNMKYIKIIDKTKIILKAGEEIPVSKRLRTNVMDSFNKYISRGYL